MTTLEEHILEQQIAVEESRQKLEPVLDELGAVPIGKGKPEDLKYIVILPTVEEWAHGFPADKEVTTQSFNEPEGVHYTVDLPNKDMVVLRVRGGKLQVRLFDLNTARWKENEAKENLVFGFNENPVPIDRAVRVLRAIRKNNGGHNAIELPLDDLYNHKAIRPVTL